jgi:hypothetical protein
MDIQSATEHASALSTFLTLTGILVTGLAVGFACVGVFIYGPYRRDQVRLMKEEVEVEKDYQQLYYEELEALEDREMSAEELHALRFETAHATTPAGAVIMFYNSDTESFWYFSDLKTIPFRTLDTVARQFTSDNDCKQVCVNYKAEWEKGKAAVLALRKDDEARKEENLPAEKSVYAAFKPYNRKGGKAKKYKILTDRCNRFTYKGRIADFVPLSRDETPEVEPVKMTFAEFKRRKQAGSAEGPNDENKSS